MLPAQGYAHPGQHMRWLDAGAARACMASNHHHGQHPGYGGYGGGVASVGAQTMVINAPYRKQTLSFMQNKDKVGEAYMTSAEVNPFSQSNSGNL